MLNKFLPNDYVKSVFNIQPCMLKERGIEGVITDLDNTLVAWDEAFATPEVIQWFKLMEDHDMKMAILSNNKYERVQVFADPLNIPFVCSARKPLKKAFHTIATDMGLHPAKIAVVGDQLLTDVLGGNLAGFYTILVVPIVKTDAKITRFNRIIERRILNYFKKRGQITWEE